MKFWVQNEKKRERPKNHFFISEKSTFFHRKSIFRRFFLIFQPPGDPLGGLKSASGENTEKFSSQKKCIFRCNLQKGPEPPPTGPREAPGTARGAPGDLPGTIFGRILRRFWVHCWCLFSSNFSMNFGTFFGYVLRHFPLTLTLTLPLALALTLPLTPTPKDSD